MPKSSLSNFELCSFLMFLSVGWPSTSWDSIDCWVPNYWFSAILAVSEDITTCLQLCIVLHHQHNDYTSLSFWFSSFRKFFIIYTLMYVFLFFALALWFDYQNKRQFQSPGITHTEVNRLFYNVKSFHLYLE